jgi:hypothetical protein
MSAKALFDIQQATSHLCVQNLTRIFVLKLAQATTPTAITKRIPFLFIHLGK